MNKKKEFIAQEANKLVSTGNKITGKQLADLLNSKGHLTGRGTKYDSGARGIYKTIHKTYDSLVEEGRQPEADDVANAFTNAFGRPAYKK